MRHSRSAIVEVLRNALTPERFAHSLRVEKTAVGLAQIHHVPRQKASSAGLLHDYARKYSSARLLSLAKKIGLPIDPLQRQQPKLLHALMGAILVKEDLGISAPDILGAIAHHTLGAPAMTKLAKIIYLADHIESGRRFSGIRKVRLIAKKDLEKAVLNLTENILKYLIRKKLPIHPGTLVTHNFYLLKLKKSR